MPNPGSGSRLDPVLLVFCGFGLVFLGYGTWLLPVLTDWVSSAVDEGYTTYAAQRIRQGDWPHRDFFFLWTPGTAYLHAILQFMGADWIAERGASLFASCGSSLLILGWGKRWGLSRGDLALLMLLLLGWSFPLWNIPYSSWYAVFIALLAMRVLPRHAIASGLLFGVAFWFKQNIGILSLLGAVSWLVLEKERVACRKLGAAFAGSLIVPFLAMFLFGGAKALEQALRQIFLFPLRYPALMGTAPERHQLAAPLTVFGLWLLSLFFLRSRSSERTAGLLQFGLIVYIGVYASADPYAFAHGTFMLLSLLAWPLSLAVEASKLDREKLRQFLLLWLPGLGVFLQVFPRADFQHFLFVFPLTALFLLRALADLKARYEFLAGGWVRLPAFLLIAAGLFLQAQVVKTFFKGQPDPMGRISYALPYRLNEEVAAVRRFLLREGLAEGGPLLVLPNATSVYQWAGFRNPTPHQQFFPGYVESYGDRESNVLTEYRSMGGRYLVVQQRSGLEQNSPTIAREIERDYEELKIFPEYFTIYVPRSRSP